VVPQGRGPGDAYAAMSLGLMYEQGWRGEDGGEALKWYRKAATTGDDCRGILGMFIGTEIWCPKMVRKQ